MNLDTVFGPTGHVNWMQECARAAVIFFYGLVLVRLGGRRIFASWSALDIVVGIVTGSSLSRALTGNAELFGTLAAITLVFALHRGVGWACVRWKGVSRAVEGVPVVLAAGGACDEELLARHAVSRTNLDEALHAAGLSSAQEARQILLQPNGRIAVLKAH